MSLDDTLTDRNTGRLTPAEEAAAIDTVVLAARPDAAPSPGEHLITIYNLNAAAASRPVDIVDTNSRGDEQGRWSSAYEATFSMRLPGGRNVTGGVGLLRAINVT